MGRRLDGGRPRRGRGRAGAVRGAHRRADNPLVDGRLFAVRAFSGASVVALAFSIAFGAMLLSIVLWCQDVWGWSTLATGLAVAPGPLMVPLFAFLVAGRLIARWGPGPVIGVGASVFAAGIIWWALAVGLAPDYAGEMLGGMLLTGAGVGLTLPTFMATGAASLPPHAFATGSAVINMLRQVGLAVGVAALVAVLGTTARGGDPTGALPAGLGGDRLGLAAGGDRRPVDPAPEVRVGGDRRARSGGDRGLGDPLEF
ncbi:MAG: MFS transporter [Solirubrobacteraceae bacterium]